MQYIYKGKITANKGKITAKYFLKMFTFLLDINIFYEQIWV